MSARKPCLHLIWQIVNAMAHSLAMWPDGKEVVGGAASLPAGFTVLEENNDCNHFIRQNEYIFYTNYCMTQM